MGRYRYVALAPSGERRAGEIDAGDRAQALDGLHRQGLLPIELDEARGGSTDGAGWFAPLLPRRGVAVGELAVVTRQLAMLLRAGQPLERALALLAGHAGRARLRAALAAAQTRLRGGMSFAEALAADRGTFSELYVNMVRAGERSGALPVVLGRLAEFLARSETIRRRIASATLYPIILLIATLGSLALMLAVVVPQFKPLFRDQGAALPLATRAIIACSDFVAAHAVPLLLAFLALLLIARQAGQRATVAARLHALALRLPLLGDLVRKTQTARFCRTLATLQRNGVPLPSGLALSAEVLTNRAMAAAIGGLTARLKQGEGLAGPLARAEVLPGLATQLIKGGEEAGFLAEALELVADVYDEQVDHAIERLFTLATPILTLLLAGMIGGMVAAIILPIIGLSGMVR
jgi:general secretion pathway protein F